MHVNKTDREPSHDDIVMILNSMNYNCNTSNKGKNYRKCMRKGVTFVTLIIRPFG